MQLLYCVFFCSYICTYYQISNTRCTLAGNKIVDHSDVVGASPVGAAPTTSSCFTWHLASIDCAKTTARCDWVWMLEIFLYTCMYMYFLYFFPRCILLRSYWVHWSPPSSCVSTCDTNHSRLWISSAISRSRSQVLETCVHLPRWT